MKTSFTIDPHVHTAESSECGHLSGVELVRQYKALGYDGIVVTDHLYEGLVSRVNAPGNWTACIDAFLKGYNAAKKEGDVIGLQVLLGAEIRFCQSKGEDFLLYGIDEDFLYGNAYVHRTSPSEFFHQYGKEVLLVQAHPFRGGGRAVSAEIIHGAEVYNTNPRHDNHNEKAQMLCEQHPHLLKLRGSDTHRMEDIGKTGIQFNETVSDTRKLYELLKTRQYKAFKKQTAS